MVTRLKRLALLTVVGAAAYAAMPAAASAVTVGQNGNNFACGGAGYSEMQVSVAGPPDYVVPSGGGVITSFRVLGNADTGDTVKLQIFRPAGSGNYTVTGESAVQGPLTPNTLNGFNTRVPVRAGDILGLAIVTTNGSPPCVFSTSSSGDVIGQYNVTPAVGTTGPPSASVGNLRVNVSAEVEADADDDGFGDATQDQCPTDPSTQGPCPGPTVSGTAVNGQALTATRGGNPNNLSFQWLRCDASGNGCAPIPGATAASYTLTFFDIGHAIRVRQLQSNASGSRTIDSAATAAVAPAPGRCTNARNGTAGNDTLLGSTGGDLIHGLAGRDSINGANGGDCLYGDAGNDRVTGAAGGDRVYGASGRDRLSGGAGNDRLFGGAGSDRISAGAGKNRVSGGSGNDVINTANGQRDTVNCGTGTRDRIRADRIDRLRGCEIRRLV